MAQQFLTDKTLFAATLDNADLIHVVDVSDTGQNAAGSSYKLTLAQLKAFVAAATPTLNEVLQAGNLTNGENITVSPADAVVFQNTGATFSTYLTNDQATAGNRTVYLPLFDGALAYHDYNTPLSNNYAVIGGVNGVLESSTVIYDNGGGYIGFGTTSPISRGHFYDNSAGSIHQLTAQNNSNIGNAGLRIMEANNNAYTISKIGSLSAFTNLNYRNNLVFDLKNFDNTQQNDFVFALFTTATNQSFRIVKDTTGLANGHSGTFFQAYANNESIGIGLGSSNPTARLHVKGSDNSSAYAFKADNLAGSPLLYVQNDGNVGIGISSPTSKLHIKSSSGTAFNVDGSSVYYIFNVQNNGKLSFTNGAQIFAALEQPFGRIETNYYLTFIGASGQPFITTSGAQTLWMTSVSGGGLSGYWNIYNQNFQLSSGETLDGQGVLSIGNATAPTANMLNGFRMYANDITAGNAAPHFRTENGSIIKLYQETTGVAAATLTGGGGTTLTDTDTFDGYTIKQVVKALRNTGLLA